mmetsp:Transcript_10771/g.33231  ORF Transcript_10771/g.33231 Transcript_10771/m.33231 type:complete len:115 (-) Transcript_10771:15-359(-)
MRRATTYAADPNSAISCSYVRPRGPRAVRAPVSWRGRSLGARPAPHDGGGRAPRRGAARPAAIRARGFEGCVDAAAQRVEAAFELPAGAYATTLLRELFVDVETERGVVGSAPD